MRNVIALVLVLATFGIVPALKAQEQSSRFELYAGYDYVRYHASPRIVGVPASESFNANSGSSQFVVNRNNWLGLVGEFTAYAVARQGFATTHEVSYRFGPRITLRRGRVTPFVHVLFGREWAEDGFTFGSVSAFAVAAGGGV